MIRQRYIITFILLLCLITLCACHKTAPATETPDSEQNTQTSTPTTTPTVTQTKPPADRSDLSMPSPTATPTNTPTPTPFCIQLIEPFDGAELPKMGKVTFSWHSTVNADAYILEFTTPSGEVVSFTTSKTFLMRYIESLPAPGEYLWQVQALDGDNNQICVSTQSHFIKSQSPIVNNPAISDEEDDNKTGNNETNNDDAKPEDFED